MKTLDIQNKWLEALEAALAARNWDAVRPLFTADAGWRDLAALTWNVRQTHDRDELVAVFGAVIDDNQPANFRIQADQPSVVGPSEGEADSLELFFEFDTKAGSANGYCFLVRDSSSSLGFSAEKMLTRLTGLRSAPPVWPVWSRFDEVHPEISWSEHVRQAGAFEQHDPEVLIVGGGQFGVMTAAHLNRLGVPALIIDKQPRVGDAWRSRYEALLLHQPHGVLYFPFMRYPENFPEYLPKDKMADWFEIYVKALDLNFWPSTELVESKFDEETSRWTAKVRLEDGSVRVMHPRHIVLATGGSGIANIPQMPGIESFKGEVVHASAFDSGARFAGKNVLIVGCGTTAHDIALDVSKAGGRPTLLQRSPLVVIDLPTANALYGDYNGRQVPTELIDTRFLAGGVYPQQKRGFIEFTKWSNEADAKLLEDLEAAGMRTWSGDDETGFYYAYLQSQAGYYINVGGSNAIIDGRIAVIQSQDIEAVTPNGVLGRDQVERPFDAIVYATAFRPMSELVERLFGRELVERLGPIWGFDNDGEMRNVLKPSAQQGLWIMSGSIPMARWHSPIVALLIRAESEGLVPPHFKDPNHPSRASSRPHVLEVGVN